MKSNRYIQLLRPKNWIKNLLVALPLLLSGSIDVASLNVVALAFISFSLLSSSVYIFNDIRDIDYDRMHPHKCQRPLASADVRIEFAFMLAVGLFLIAILMDWLLIGSCWILVLYFVVNYFYSTVGKRVRFLDIMLLTTFYLLRVFYGSEVANVELTGWFAATITMAVLAVSVHKRYMECVNAEYNVIPGRGYTKNDIQLLRNMMYNFSMVVQVLLNIHAYFVLNITSAYFFCLINMVAGCIMFVYFDESKNRSEDPVSRILHNKILLILLLIFFSLYSYEVIVHSE